MDIEVAARTRRANLHRCERHSQDSLVWQYLRPPPEIRAIWRDLVEREGTHSAGRIILTQ